MSDYRLDAYCDHSILDFALTIDGTSPNYYSTLLYPSNGDPTAMSIREFSATEGLTIFESSINGITNFSLTTNSLLTFNTLGFLPNVSYVEGLTTVQPQRLYLASYTTVTQSCPMCRQQNTRQDVSFDVAGSVDIIEGNDKLAQQLVKILLTELTNNRLHSDYGSVLNTYIGQNLDDFMEFNIQQSVQSAIAYLIDQQQRSIVEIPPEETIVRMSGLIITRDSVDPRKISIQVSVTTAILQEVIAKLTLSTV